MVCVCVCGCRIFASRPSYLSGILHLITKPHQHLSARVSETPMADLVKEIVKTWKRNSKKRKRIVKGWTIIKKWNKNILYSALIVIFEECLNQLNLILNHCKYDVSASIHTAYIYMILNLSYCKPLNLAFHQSN